MATDLRSASLGPREVRTLGLRAGAVIAGLSLVGLTSAFLMPLTCPSVQKASFFSSRLVAAALPVLLMLPT